MRSTFDISFLTIFLLYICENAKLVSPVSFEEDTTMTASQAQILDKFRERVKSRLPHEYMKESIYLVKWLRARNFDMDRTEEMLLSHLKWRRDNRMDTVDKEDWQNFPTEFPWSLDSFDKEGRPLVQIVLRDWDIRRAMLSGNRERLTRWIYKYFEDATKRVRQLQSDGKNVTQFTLLLDAEGFNVVTHGCPLCIQVYLTIAGGYEEHFPGSIHNIHVINTPEFFNVIIRLVTPVLSQDTRKALKIHGTNRNMWRQVLSKEIDDNQLWPSFGGTMKSSNDL